MRKVYAIDRSPMTLTRMMVMSGSTHMRLSQGVFHWRNVQFSFVPPDREMLMGVEREQEYMILSNTEIGEPLKQLFAVKGWKRVYPEELGLDV